MHRLQKHACRARVESIGRHVGRRSMASIIDTAPGPVGGYGVVGIAAGM